MGLPVPEDMDGRILVDAFTAGYMEAFPPESSESSAQAEMVEAVGYTEEGEKEILERLRGMGYLG